MAPRGDFGCPSCGALAELPVAAQVYCPRGCGVLMTRRYDITPPQIGRHHAQAALVDALVEPQMTRPTTRPPADVRSRPISPGGVMGMLSGPARAASRAWSASVIENLPGMPVPRRP